MAGEGTKLRTSWKGGMLEMVQQKPEGPVRAGPPHPDPRRPRPSLPATARGVACGSAKWGLEAAACGLQTRASALLGSPGHRAFGDLDAWVFGERP